MPGQPPLANLYSLAHLPASLHAALARAATLAAAQGSQVWLVGGVVRDLLRGDTPTRDLDLAIEGDALALAAALTDVLDIPDVPDSASETGRLTGQIKAQHAAFGTATIELHTPAGPVLLDLARTRREYYPHPAALPVVQPASIQDDLGRRDFSLNALALPVFAPHAPGDPVRMGALLDLYQGYDDLAHGRLRVLHDQSFRDDPTRIMRGVRLAARLGLSFEPHTRALLAQALAADYLGQTTPDRVRTELCLVLDEPDPLRVVQMADTLALSPRIAAGLGGHPDLERFPIQQTSDPLVRAGLLTYRLTGEERTAFCQRYRLSKEAARLLHDVARLQEQSPLLAQFPNLPNSRLDEALRPCCLPALQTVQAAEAPPVSSAIAHYLHTLREVRPLLNGHDLQRLGVAPGPQLGRLLEGLRLARLDGQVQSRADEEAWVRGGG